ncbi:MAG: tyrosine-type recombinase/integrase [Planctomycetota bacterium]
MKSSKPVHTYNNGQPYSEPRGRQSELRPFTQLGPSFHSIVRGFPDQKQFLDAVRRELKIRYYSRLTVKSYISYLRTFLDWFGQPPHRVTNEDIRNYFELLVDGNCSSSHLAGNLSAIRTAFDKFCGRDVTLGMVTPRKSRRQPFTLSRDEIGRLMDAAPRHEMKLALGLMYALGLRNSEICSLRVRDFDFEQKLVRVEQGKGRVDRWVVLPDSIKQSLRQRFQGCPAESFVFRSSEFGRNRSITPRTLQRWVGYCAARCGLKKKVTPPFFSPFIRNSFVGERNGHSIYSKIIGPQAT